MPFGQKIKAHREVVWVILGQIRTAASAVVVTVGMWATRLRCPSCPQRCWVLDPWSCDEAVAPPIARQGAITSEVESPRGYRAGSMQVRILSRR